MEDLDTKEASGRLDVIDGFTIEACQYDDVLLITVEDLRAHPDYQNDRSVRSLSDVFTALIEAGLSIDRAVVSLKCRQDPISKGSSKTFNVNIIQFGLVKTMESS